MKQIPCIVIGGCIGGLVGVIFNSIIAAAITGFLLFYVIRVLTGAYKRGSDPNK